MENENTSNEDSSNNVLAAPMVPRDSPSTCRGQARELADDANQLHQTGMDKLYALSVLFGTHVAESIETPFRDSNSAYLASAGRQMDATSGLYSRVHDLQSALNFAEDQISLLKANLACVVTAGVPLSNRAQKQKSKISKSDADHFDRAVFQAERSFGTDHVYIQNQKDYKHDKTQSFRRQTSVSANGKFMDTYQNGHLVSRVLNPHRVTLPGKPA
jgi:hypothetical protein